MVLIILSTDSTVLFTFYKLCSLPYHLSSLHRSPIILRPPHFHISSLHSFTPSFFFSPSPSSSIPPLLYLSVTLPLPTIFNPSTPLPITHLASPYHLQSLHSFTYQSPCLSLPSSILPLLTYHSPSPSPPFSIPSLLAFDRFANLVLNVYLVCYKL